MRPSLTDEQRIAWLRLARSVNIGAITFSDLINRFGSAEAALEALPEIRARAGGHKAGALFSKAQAEQELEEAQLHNIRHIAFGESDYSALLRNIPDRPPILLVKGNLDLNSRPGVAVVGSRNTSIVGQKVAYSLAKDLGEQGFVTVSGLARGIDTVVHKASLGTLTVGVLAGGHHHIYPPENKKLIEDIIAVGGAIVTEMPPSFEPRGQDFPRRNRIISGLSLGTCIVEAARRSGSLVTARLAGEQGRLVFAVPGSPLDPRAEGTNQLIRNGAILIRNADDVVEDLRPLLSNSNPDTENGQEPFKLETSATESEFDEPFPPSNAHEQILSQLSQVPILVDDLIRFSDLPTSVVLSALCDLEIADRIMRHDGNRISLVVKMP